jgi:hypothetical protein
MEKNVTQLSQEKVNVQTSNNILLKKFQPGISEKTTIDRPAKGVNQVIYDYIDKLGISNCEDLVILSSRHHYYYDDEDLLGVKTVLNLKHLNYIKDIKEFLNTVNKMLSYKSYFVGTFLDRKNHSWLSSSPVSYNHQMQGAVDPVENGIVSRFPLFNMIYDFMDSRTNRNMTEKSVMLLLANAGLKVTDMREINGLTCFCSQKIAPPRE